MTSSLTPFAMIEVAVMELIEALMPEASGDRIGGGLSYDAGDDFYVYVGMVPGSASADATAGSWAVDVDVFDSTYGQAMRRALALEALLLTPGGKVTPSMRIDRVTENEGPSERPWDDDDSAYRVGATYVFTARRRG